MTDNHARLSPALVESIAGLSAGTASTLAVHPLDVWKTRLQVNRSSPGAPASSLAILRSIVNTPHPIQSLYRGLTPNLVGNASSWALFFYFKSSVETQLRLLHARPGPVQETNGNPRVGRDGAPNADLSPSDYFLSSFVAGVSITLCTNPIWVIKTRMLSTNAGAEGAYPSMWSGAKSVMQKEGLRGFYRGVVPSLFGVTHGGVQFAVYDPLKRAWAKHVTRRDGQQHRHGSEEQEQQQVRMGTVATLGISSLAKIIAGTATYPYQVLRSRMQMQDAEKRFGRGIKGVVGGIWAEGGITAFYKGIGPNIARVLPATWVTFLVYENMKFYLSRRDR